MLYNISAPVRPDVAPGNRRRPCACRARESVRWRICDTSREGGDWRLVAEMNRVNAATARIWIKLNWPHIVLIWTGKGVDSGKLIY